MAIVERIGAVRYNVAKWNEVKKFWMETVGLPVVWASDEMGWAEFGPEDGCHIAIQRAGPNTPAASGSRGIKCDEVQVVPGTVAFSNFYDPEGNVIGIAGDAK